LNNSKSTCPTDLKFSGKEAFSHEEDSSKIWLQKTKHVKSKVVSILLAIFWRQQISWSYCAGSQRFGLVAWRNVKKKSLCQENAV